MCRSAMIVSAFVLSMLPPLVLGNSLAGLASGPESIHPAKALTNLNPGISGSWYDPSKDQQGFTMQYLNPQALLLTWFTYDTQGNQRWMQGVGEISGNEVDFQMFRKFGPRFGPDFNPADAELELTGTLTLRFDTCNSGLAQYSGYSGPNGLPADTLNIVRITSVAGYSCDDETPASIPAPLHRGLSGAWYDASHDGEGWMIELLNPDVALVYWFTYDSQGRQVWLISVAEIRGNALFAGPAVRPVGGRFGPNYDPTDVTQEIWGAFGISFVGCNRATMAYAGPQAFGSGGLGNVTRIVGVGDASACAFPGGLRKLSGALEAAPFTLSDGDTNDPFSVERPNNTPAQVQVSNSNPAVISGFAAESAVGGQGRFGNRADEFDAYRLPLTAGQSLQLIIADWDSANPGRNDLDLLLYASNNPSQPIATSETIGRNEFVQITQSGQYDVLVLAYNGASNYTLAATFAPIPQGFQALSSLGDFVPGEAIVRFDDDGLTNSKSAQQIEAEQSTRAEALGLVLKQAAVDGPVLMALDEFDASGARLKSAGIDVGRTAKLLAEHGYGLGRAGEERRSELVAALKALQARADVRYAEPNLRVYNFAVPNDPRFPEQWHYRQINMPQAWDLAVGSSNVLVGVADTGVHPHPDLASNVRFDLGYDFVNLLMGMDGDGPDPDARDPGGSFHGTHVAGTIAAITNNGTGVAGVAPGVRIMPIRVLGRGGGGDAFSILNGLAWAGNQSMLPGASPPGRSVDVLNLSLGGLFPCSIQWQDAINTLRSRGVIVVAAAGNDNTSRPTSPASCSGVVSVSAVNQNADHAIYSNCGSTVDVAASGGEMGPESATLFAPFNSATCKGPRGRVAPYSSGVLSTHASGGAGTGFPISANYSPMAGTSMAAPHVAGVAALMKSVHPGLTPAQFDQLLSSGQLTRDLGPPGRDDFFGHGLIDARKAVEAARNLAGGAPAPAVLIVEPATVDFGEVNDRLTIRLRKAGSGPLTLTNANPDQPWLQSLTAQSGVTPEGFGDYELRINRQGLPPGQYQGTLGLTTMPVSQAPVALQVSMRVGQPQVRGDAGLLYLLLIDGFTGQIIDFLAGTGSQGRYTFEIPGLVPGEYLLVATSDNDFDRWICDAGEFCGFFPSEPGGLVLGSSDLDVGTIPVFPDTSGLGQTGAGSNALSEFGAAHGKLDQRPFAVRLQGPLLEAEWQKVDGIDRVGGSLR